MDAGSSWPRSPDLSGPAYTATNGRFKWENHDALEQMQQADREAWLVIEYQLGDRDHEAWESNR
jgi:hypothetical protein